jgi:hypothetical protein
MILLKTNGGFSGAKDNALRRHPRAVNGAAAIAEWYANSSLSFVARMHNIASLLNP